jgi:hypothetical protein
MTFINMMIIHGWQLKQWIWLVYLYLTMDTLVSGWLTLIWPHSTKQRNGPKYSHITQMKCYISEQIMWKWVKYGESYIHVHKQQVLYLDLFYLFICSPSLPDLFPRWHLLIWWLFMGDSWNNEFDWSICIWQWTLWFLVGWHWFVFKVKIMNCHVSL